MRPILFRFRNVTVWSYPALLYFALTAGVAAGNLAAHDLGVDPLRSWVATLALLFPALIGPRLLYVAAHWPLFRNQRSRIWNLRYGGLDLYGGFFFAFALSIPLLNALRLNLGAFWDVATFTMLVGLIFARIGCLLNGCCAGRPSQSWLGMNLPNSMRLWQKRIPVPLLEAAWAALLLSAATCVRHSLPFPGALFLLAAAGYAAGRFLIEFARDHDPRDTEFLLSRALSLVTLVTSIFVLTVHWPR